MRGGFGERSSRAALAPLILFVLFFGGLLTPTLTFGCPSCGTQYQRGDANADGSIDLSDPVRVLLSLFGTGVLPCLDAADANDDDAVDVSDGVFLLDHLFAGGAAIPTPAGFCGTDPFSTLGCASYPPCSNLPAGAVPEDWIHGSANCSLNNDPPFQIEEYDENTFILRQNMCSIFEGPFLYLLFGADKVLLLDSGGVSNPAISPLRATVDGIIDQWLLARGQSSIELVVAHTHSHGDHIAGDSQFFGRPNTSIVGTNLSAVTSFFGISNWPTEEVCYDLGGRVLDIVPIPGHESRHIAIFDPTTGILLTGDSLYPGFLFVFGQSNWNTYKQSIERLVDFALARPVIHILGTHVEMTATPGVAYPYGTDFQPDEHPLRLGMEHLLELHDALTLLPNPVVEVHDDFIITGQ